MPSTLVASCLRLTSCLTAPQSFNICYAFDMISPHFVALFNFFSDASGCRTLASSTDVSLLLVFLHNSLALMEALTNSELRDETALLCLTAN